MSNENDQIIRGLKERIIIFIYNSSFCMYTTYHPRKCDQKMCLILLFLLTHLTHYLTTLTSSFSVTVTAQDFAQLSFSEQVRLAHSASILLSMHGAGTTHIFHSAVGSPQCCALIELFPDHTIEFFTAQVKCVCL